MVKTGFPKLGGKKWQNRRSQAADDNRPDSYRTIHDPSLRGIKASNTKSISFATTDKLANRSESIPAEQTWWAKTFLLGSGAIIQSSYKNGANSATTSTFATPGSSAAIISQVAFPPEIIETSGGTNLHQINQKMAVVCGPRVFIYGSQTNSSLTRSLDRSRRIKGKDKDKSQSRKRKHFNEDEAMDNDGNVKPDHNLQTGGYPAHTASYHPDGRLLVVGCDHGLVKIFDSITRITLRTVGGRTYRSAIKKGHPIRSVGWLPEDMISTVTADGTPTTSKRKILWSAGDDAVARIWDLGGSGSDSQSGLSGVGGFGDDTKPIYEFRGHGDSIRSCQAFSVSSTAENESRRDFLVSSSYDHTIRVWDLEGLVGGSNASTTQDENRCVTVMDHGAPVECILVIADEKNPNQIPVVISAGGTKIKVWHALLGKCLYTLPTKHSKTITSIAIARILYGEGDDGINTYRVYKRRLLSAGLDGLVRIYDLENFYTVISGVDSTRNEQSYIIPFLHGVKTKEPITTLNMNPAATRMVIGTTTGSVIVKQRAKFLRANGPKRQKTREPYAGTYAYLYRGSTAVADADHHLVHQQTRKTLSKYDYLFKKFQFGECLDQALTSGNSFTVVAVLEELGKQDGLVQAISNRDESTLEPLLAFTNKFIAKPQYAEVITGVANLIIDIYSEVIGQSETIDLLFSNLCKRVRRETQHQQSILQVIGQIDAAMYSAEMNLMNEEYED